MVTSRLSPEARCYWCSNVRSRFTKPVNEYGARQAVASFSLVEFLAGLAAEFGVLQPVEGKQGAFQPAEFPECRGQTVLPWVGGALTQDERAVTAPVRMDVATRRMSG